MCSILIFYPYHQVQVVGHHAVIKRFYNRMNVMGILFKKVSVVVFRFEIDFHSHLHASIYDTFCLIPRPHVFPASPYDLVKTFNM